jgi:CRISPR-associated protein Csm1
MMAETPTPKLEEVVLAALFHDLGKFGQRAGAERSENLKETFCPKSPQGWHSHVHVLNTDHFIEQVLPLPRSLGLNRGLIARMAANHHKTDWDDRAEACIAIADHLASGADRSKGDGEQNEDSQGYIKSRLVSIFQEVELLRNSFDAAGTHATYALQRIDEGAYPETRPELSTAEAKLEYRQLWDQFAEELQSHSLLQNENLEFGPYLSILLTTLERYLWCVPAASFKTIPDISLHDHGLLTAALAQALWCWHASEGGLPDRSKKDKDFPKFLLYGGDLSGIQSYIFDLNKSHSTGVAKLYRARSFYLQMLTKSVVLEALDRLKLFPVAQVMDAGGKFMLMLPNTPSVHQALNALEVELNQAFLREFNGQLSLNTCRLEASFNELLLEPFKHTLNRFFDLLDEAKLHKFSNLFAEGQSMVLENEYEDGYDSNCQVCETLPFSREGTALYHKDYPRSSVKLSRIVAQQICWLGKDLANEEKSHIVLTQAAGEDHGVKRLVPLLFDWKVAVTTEADAQIALNTGDRTFNRQGYGDHAFHPVAGHLPRIAAEDLERWQQKAELFQTMQEEEEARVEMPKSFSMIAHAGKHWSPDRGRSFLGAFKADVDNLGLIFSIGFTKEKTRLSISRFASLSRMLNHFFSVELIRLVKERAPDCYVVFAGGDDLFFLGPWVDVIELGLHLRQRFQDFSAGNPDITLSAGIGVFKASQPIREIATQAEALLENAKHFSQEGQLKNAVSLFGEVVPWDQLGKLLQRGQELDDLMQRGVLPSGLVNRLLGYSRQRRRFRQHRQMRDGLYLSHLAYDLARNLDARAFERKDLTREDHARFVGAWSAPDSDYLDAAEIPLHFALYRNRK